MNTLEIQECLLKIHPSLHKNVYAANRLPIRIQKPTLLVSNLDSDTQPGSHWVAIHIDDSSVGQYFDTYGRPPEGFQRTFLDRNCRVWDYNTKRIQNDWTSVCGEYCIVYLYYKYHGKSLSEFTSNFDSNLTMQNDIVLYDMFKYYFE